MKLTIVGGGGFRVPQIIEALATRPRDLLNVDQVCLYDVSEQRLSVMRDVLEALPVSPKPVLDVTTDLATAVTGADFIFSAMRVGGTCARVLDEKIALGQGILGQETVGPGGYAYAFRTIPFARQLAEAVKEHAPEAWVINFTNPAGIITQAMRAVMGSHVIGICDTPIGLVRRVGRALGLGDSQFDYDYVGLNHLGWLRSIMDEGHNQLPRLLETDELLNEIEEARIIGFDWVRQLGMIPNEYLFYYYHTREAVAQIRAEYHTRGEYLDEQQGKFYRAAGETPDQAATLWDNAHKEREATYMAEARAISNEDARHQEDLTGGGYQEVALDLMTALSTGISRRMILGVSNSDGDNGLIIPALGKDAVVEVPCIVDATGVHPQAVAPLTGPELGLVTQVKACEELVIEAAVKGDRGLAWQALASHPLVDSITVARKIFDEYCEKIPEVAEVFK